MVVDTGPDPDVIDSCLADLGIDVIDTVVLTHFHADHVNGLPGVLRGRRVGHVLVTSIEEPPEQAAFVMHALAAAGIVPVIAHADDTGTSGGISWRVLWPRRRLEAGSVPNNASIVLLLTVDGVRMLLTGDVEPEAQAAMIAAESGVQADIVKVPHHGSRYQDPRLPSWTHARLALISVGEGNMYGHPAAETIEAWTAAGALVARTDTGGDLAVVGGSTPGLVSRRG
jgi:competence protein ComEC